MSEPAPVSRDDITPVIEFVLARVGERRAGFAGGTCGELATAYPVEAWMESVVYRYRGIVRGADAADGDEGMEPWQVQRRTGYILALSVAIETMADIWAGHPAKPVCDYRTGLWSVPGQSG